MNLQEIISELLSLDKRFSSFAKQKGQPNGLATLDSLGKVPTTLLPVDQFGKAGPQGPQGESGATGPQGPPGQDGQNGEDGVDGVTDYNLLSNKPSLHSVATSGNYNDLSNKPSIPTQYTAENAQDDVGGILSGEFTYSDSTPSISVNSIASGKITGLHSVATSGDYTALSNKPVAPTYSTGLTNTSGTITANLATGVSGGQTVVGGIASGEDLTLSSTSFATKGKIILGSSNFFFNEATGVLSVGQALGAIQPAGGRVHMRAGSDSELTTLTMYDTADNVTVRFQAANVTTGGTILSFPKQDGNVDFFNYRIIGSANGAPNTIRVGTSNAAFNSSLNRLLVNGAADVATVQFISSKVSMTQSSTALAGTAILHLGAGSATAGTAPLKFTSGTVLSTLTSSVEDGAMEYNGTHFSVVIGSTRYQIDPVMTTFTSGSGTVSNGDTYQQALQKIDGNVGLKAPLASPTFTGTPSLPTGTTGVTQAVDDNTTKLATTAFVIGQAYAKLASPTFTGTPTLPTGTIATTQAVDTNTTTIATTAFVIGQSYAKLASPTFTGTPTLPTGTIATTQAVDDSSTKIATTAYVVGQGYAKLASPTFSGTPSLPTGTTGVTQAVDDSTTKLATTAYVVGQSYAKLASPTFTGTPTLPTGTIATTQTSTDSSTKIATTAFVATSFAPLASPTFSGTPSLPTGTTGVTQTATDSSTKLATTAFVVAATPNTSYRVVGLAAAQLTATAVAGTYALTYGDLAVVSGAGSAYPVATVYIDTADYPTVAGVTAKMRLRAQVHVNDVAPTGNYTVGLYPITRPATSGGAGVNIFTIGTLVTGSATATVTTPAADSSNTVVGSDFAVPTTGHYVIAVLTTATVATSSHLHIAAQLQLRNA